MTQLLCLTVFVTDIMSINLAAMLRIETTGKLKNTLILMYPLKGLYIQQLVFVYAAKVMITRTTSTTPPNVTTKRVVTLQQKIPTR